MYPREARLWWYDVPMLKTSASKNVLELQGFDDC